MSNQTPSPCPTTPPHCPNPSCRFHHPQPDPWPFQKFGTFTRLNPPHTVQRFRCQACRRTFSTQTFSITYWLKRPELLLDIQKHAVSGASNRQIARILRCAPSTVDNHLARLGRHCLLYHRHLLAQASPFVDIVIDGLVTFEYSQYHPYEILTAVDRNSSFFIHFAEAERRRSGTMTPYQKQRRSDFEDRHRRPDPKAVLEATIEVLSAAIGDAPRAHVWSDKHRAYPAAIRRLTGCEIEHETIDSRAKRTRRNPLFEVNCLDMLIRHCMKDHTRESIAFAKRRQHSLYRLAIFLVWRNYIKLRRERRCQMTPAMQIGLLDRALTEEDVQARRLFVGQVDLTPSWEDYYWRRVKTRPLAVNRGHDLKFAA
jgi:transposase-like protein